MSSPHRYQQSSFSKSESHQVWKNETFGGHIQKTYYCPEKLSDGRCRAIKRDYIHHEPYYRYIVDTADNHMKRLGKRQRKALRELLRRLEEQEQKKLQAQLEREERLRSLQPAEKQPPEPELDDEMKQLIQNPKRHPKHEPPFRYYESLWRQYGHLMTEDRQKAISAKYAELKERRHGSSKDGADTERPKKATRPDTSAHLCGPKFRYVEHTFANYKDLLNEGAKNKIQELYESLKRTADENASKHKGCFEDQTPPSKARSKDEPEVIRNYEKEDPKLARLDDTLRNFEQFLNPKYLGHVQEKHQALVQQAESRRKHADPDEGRENKRRNVKRTQKPLTEQQLFILQQEKKNRRKRLCEPVSRVLVSNYDSFRNTILPIRQRNLKYQIAIRHTVSIEKLINRQSRGEGSKLKPKVTPCEKEMALKKQILFQLHQKLLEQIPNLPLKWRTRI